MGLIAKLGWSIVASVLVLALQDAGLLQPIVDALSAFFWDVVTAFI